MLFSDCALLAKRPFMVLQSILQVDNLPRRVEHGNGMELASQRTDSAIFRYLDDREIYYSDVLVWNWQVSEPTLDPIGTFALGQHFA